MALARRHRTALDIWPGFVDALASLLMVIIFLLMIFVVSQLTLNEALVGRDRQLEDLNNQVAELAEMLALERRTTADLRENVASLSAELSASLARRERMETDLTASREERARLDAELAAAQSARAALAEDLAAAERTIEADRETIEAQLSELARLQEDILALTALREELLAELEDADLDLEARAQALAATEAELADTERRLADAERTLDQTQELLVAYDSQLRARAGEAAASREEVLLLRGEQARLNRQIQAFRDQIAELNALLELYEERNREAEAQIVNLGERLNAALATKVQELARYRSEFFGRLREVLGQRGDIQIVGDRFVFQSEVLFDPGSAELGPDGRIQLAQLADTLRDITADIPGDIDWILRVDGHTDRVPIATTRFPSNWELSAARAISVVKFLIDQGIPPERLAAAGFGEYQPLDAAEDEIAFRRNRRIEMKLDQR